MKYIHCPTLCINQFNSKILKRAFKGNEKALGKLSGLPKAITISSSLKFAVLPKLLRRDLQDLRHTSPQPIRLVYQ